MKVEHIEILVEEPSAEAALQLLVPRILGEVPFAIRQFQSKSELLIQLPKRLKGYAKWLPPTSRILVLVDRDDDNCTKLKANLEKIAQDAGLATRTKPGKQGYSVANRVIIEELESWYFGDWQAVIAAYPRVDASIPRQAKYRDPDGIRGGTWEALERILQKAGYFDGGLAKIEAARTIGAQLDPARNQSRSFQVFRDVLLEMAA